MIITPWLVPASNVGKFLLSLQGFNDVINQMQQPIDQVMLNLTWLSRSFGVMGSLVALSPLLIACLIMRKLVQNYAQGYVFNLTNAKAYRQLGWIYLVNALFFQPLYQILFSLCITLNNPAGHRVISFSIGLQSLTAIFFSLVLIMLGQVMKLAQQIDEEQQLTI